MVRKILFRGKCVKNGKWVYGSFVELEEGDIVICKTSDKGKVGICCGSHDGFAFRPKLLRKVIPETVGQYTGLKDSNGVKIFEGDICKFEYFGNKNIGKITYNEKTCGLEIRYNTIVGAYGEKATSKIMICHCDNVEIIGNIFDNPELLKGE